MRLKNNGFWIACFILTLLIIFLMFWFNPAFAITGYVHGELKDVKRYIGEFTVTTYDDCKSCNGKWVGYPAKNGEPLEVGKTIAVDESIIPLNSNVYLKFDDGTELKRKAQDTGNKIVGNKIDLLIDTCKNEITYYNVEVWIYE